MLKLAFAAVSVVTLLMAASLVEAANCTISAVGVNFGSYDVFSSTAVVSTGSTTFSCTGIGAGSLNVTVWLSTGTAGNFNPRKLFRSTESLNYNLYLNAGGTQIWGDGTGGSTLLSASVLNNRPVTQTIFGQIPALQDVSVGSYNDTIIATINF